VVDREHPRDEAGEARARRHPRGVEVLKQDPLLRQAIHDGARLPEVAVAAQVVRPERIHDDKQDIHPTNPPSCLRQYGSKTFASHIEPIGGEGLRAVGSRGKQSWAFSIECLSEPTYVSSRELLLSRSFLWL